MLAMERDRLDKQRAFREQELQRKQCAESPGPKSLAPSAAAPVAVRVRERPRLLQFFLDRLNSYNTQATLVTGFAFTAFSADALHDLPYTTSPIRSWLFASFAACAMGSAVSVVCISSYLMARAEQLALTTSVGAGLAAMRQRMPTVTGFYFVSLIGLFGAASTLQFAMCHADDDDDTCERVGVSVVIVFCCCCAALLVLQRIRMQFNRYGLQAGSLAVVHSHPVYYVQPGDVGHEQPGSRPHADAR